MPSSVPLLGTICTSGGVRERPENGRFQPFFVLWLSVQIRADTGLIGNFHSILHGIEPPLGSGPIDLRRSEEQTSELQSLIRNSYAVFCLQKKNERHYQNEH